MQEEYRVQNNVRWYMGEYSWEKSFVDKSSAPLLLLFLTNENIIQFILVYTREVPTVDVMQRKSFLLLKYIEASHQGSLQLQGRKFREVQFSHTCKLQVVLQVSSKPASSLLKVSLKISGKTSEDLKFNGSLK